MMGSPLPDRCRVREEDPDAHVVAVILNQAIVWMSAAVRVRREGRHLQPRW